MWQGANVKRRSRSSRHSYSNAPESPRRRRATDGERGNRSKSTGKPRSTETVEAALHRLSKAYETSIECLSSWHRAAAASTRKDNEAESGCAELDPGTLATLTRIARTTRDTLQLALLQDSLVQAYAGTPYLAAVLNESTHRPSGLVVLSSAVHRSTVQKLAYLALTNYADLLIQGCACRHARYDQKCSGFASLLDTSLLAPLLVSPPCVHCCWKRQKEDGEGSVVDQWNEDEQRTAQLALAAYLDALALQTTADPTLWFKVATTARHLDRLHAAGKTLTSSRRYRRLELYALEMSHACWICHHRPPNRLIQKALEEWESNQSQWDHEDLVSTRNEFSVQQEPTKELIRVLSIPRYSWAVLGRMIVRTVRGGEGGAASGLMTGLPVSQSTPPLQIQLQLSPLLVVPIRTVLARILQYLGPPYHSLEATCRALSTAVLAAQVQVDIQQQQNKTASLSDETPLFASNLEMPFQSQERGDSVVPSKPQTSSVEGKAENKEDAKQQAQASRVSKRLQSRELSTGKRAERRSRRSSVEYCLVSTVLGHNLRDPRYQGLQDVSLADIVQGWRLNAVPVDEDRKESALPSGLVRKPAQQVNSSGKDIGIEASERASSASIWAFARETSASRDVLYTPMGLLFGFLAHVSEQIAFVYSSENSHHGTIVLSTCLLDALALLVSRSQSISSWLPCWSFSDARFTEKSRFSERQIFAVDLLHAELRFKRCEQTELQQHSLDTTLESDSNFVAQILPSLLSRAGDEESSDVWKTLQIRTFWLAAVFGLWQGRLMQADVRAAETESLEYIDMILKSLPGPKTEIRTPHLEGLGRAESYWKVISLSTMAAFRNGIQASSVVLDAQEQFAEVMRGKGSEDGMKKSVIEGIGSALLKRYETPIGKPESNHMELVNDFISLHETELLSMILSPDNETITCWCESMYHFENIEDSRNTRNDSILAILCRCLEFSNKRVDMLRILIKTTVALGNASDEILDSIMNRVSRNNEGDDRSEASSLDSESDEMGQDERKTGSNLRLYSRFGSFLLILIRLGIDKLDDAEIAALIMDEDFSRFMASAFGLASQSKQHAHGALENNEMSEDAFLFGVIQFLLFSIETRIGESFDVKGLKQEHLKNLMLFLVVQQRIVSSLIGKPRSQNPTSAIPNHHFSAQIDLLGEVCISLSNHCYDNLCTTTDARIARSPMIGSSKELLQHVCWCLIWLWNFAMLPGVLSTDARLRLRCRLATTIIGMCGSGAFTKELQVKPSEQSHTNVSLDDLFDSDVSVHKLTSAPDNMQIQELVRVCVTASQTICAVMDRVPVEDLRGSSEINDAYTNHGSQNASIPEMVVRVVGFFADSLLCHTGRENAEKKDRSRIWSDFGFGTRKIGTQIDSLLYRGYDALYGFNLVGLNDGKEMTGTSHPSQVMRKPESVAAAAQLYRCVMRAYGFGRKCPPRNVIQTIMAALPETPETSQSAALKKLLFSTEKRFCLDKKQILAIVESQPTWQATLPEMTSMAQIYAEESASADGYNDDEATQVKSGLSALISEAPMPSLDATLDEDPRAQTAQMETELAEKFHAILFKIVENKKTSCAMWYRAFQVCQTKAELIADRLGRSSGYTSSYDFYCKRGQANTEALVPLLELLDKQNKEAVLHEVGWVSFLGLDLAVFVSHNWSSFDSLKQLQHRILKDSNPESLEEEDSINIVTEIAGLLKSGKYEKWQQAWGGLFVAALRELGFRCMVFALSLLHIRNSNDGRTSESENLIVEICESLGTELYKELMGSQKYGYPMHRMTQKTKRVIAEAALACFKRAQGKAACENNNNPERVGWDLLLMEGKCNEKIASTYKGQDFPVDTEAHCTRRYESFLKESLEAYSKSLKNAQADEKEGLLAVEVQGGSGHGATEVLYRLHATRLKCIIYAVSQREKRREAELEALRLTEKFEFSKRANESTEERTTSDRLWQVATDIVSVMVHCRSQHSHFHRSVFRHAQALMWAPVICCDPKSGRDDGSFGVVPAIRALSMRGLNSDGAVESGSTVIRTLFDKKRTQLCGVWLTESTARATSPFHVINLSTRKYDALRGKYIGAYLQCLQLRNSKEDLENFVRWTAGSRRDLPSFFDASSDPENEISIKSQHTGDCLVPKGRSLASMNFLTSVKRHANAALASVILHDLDSSKSSRDAKFLENQFKLAYSCVLRLNCEPSTLAKRRVRHLEGIKPVVDALIAAYSRIRGDQVPPNTALDWSMDGQVGTLVQAALAEAKESFPSLSGSFLTARRTTKKKKKHDEQLGTIAGSKRKEPDGTFTVLQQFKVSVPSDLTPGETFLTEIQAGENKVKRIRLTVPSGGATNLRFQLRVPAE